MLDKTNLMTAADVCAMLGIKESSLKMMIYQGRMKLQRLKEGRNTYYLRAEVEHYVDNLPPPLPRRRKAITFSKNCFISCQLTGDQYNEFVQITAETRSPIAVVLRRAITEFMERYKNAS